MMRTLPKPPDRGEPSKAQRAVQSIEVGGRLLLALAGQPGPMILKDLAAAAGLPASRAHPYLVSFARLGLVEQDTASGRYALGPAALQLGLTALHQLDSMRAASPVAEALAADTGQAVALAVWGNFGPTIVRLIESEQPLHLAMRAGTVMSVFGTATGRAFAAVLPRKMLDEVARGPLGGPRHVDHAAAKGSARELEELAAEWRTHGVTRAVGRPLPGVNAFSAPVFDHQGQAVLVVTALGHQDEFPSDWDSPLSHAVKAAAETISARLGRPPAAAG